MIGAGFLAAISLIAGGVEIRPDGRAPRGWGIRFISAPALHRG